MFFCVSKDIKVDFQKFRNSSCFNIDPLTVIWINIDFLISYKIDFD